MRSRYWIDYPATALEIDPARTVAVLPTAAIEQHGPHLPVGVDTMINQGLCDLLAQSCPEALDIRLLPVQCVGKSNEHLWAAGTITLSAETAMKAWTEIGLSLARAGVKKALILNSHGGNADLISIVARELRVRAGMYCVRMGWGAGGSPEGLYGPQEAAQGIHGGDNETSLMLHFRPETVDMSKAQDFRWAHNQGDIAPVGGIAHGWIASDVNAAGVAGEAHLASAEKGRVTAEHYVRNTIEVIERMVAFDASGYAPVNDPYPA
ncbi:MAG: creatininase family protein [Pseudomonadota bacterium]